MCSSAVPANSIACLRAGDARHGGEVLGFQLCDSSARETSALDGLELRRRGLLVLRALELIL
jgi:hypothetical protein